MERFWWLPPQHSGPPDLVAEPPLAARKRLGFVLLDTDEEPA